MKKSMRIVMAVAFGAFAAVSACAKDRPSLALEAGAVGSEKRYTTSSSGYPYTRTTFNPDIRLGIDLPITDIKETCFFGLKLAYDLSWEKYNSSSRSAYTDNTTLTHTISFLPELVFVKNDLRLIFDTGISFGINPYKTEKETSSSRSSQEYKILQLLWTSELALKYCLTDHFSAIAGLTVSVPFVTYYRNGSGNNYEDILSVGRYSMNFCPRVGLSYMF